MIIDKLNVFDWAAALTVTRESTDEIDLVNGRDLGFNTVGNPSLKVRVLITTAMLSTGSSTLTITFLGSTDSTTWETYVSSPALPKASLVAGFYYDLAWAPKKQGDPLPRYIRLGYAVGTADMTAGALSAFVVLDQQQNLAYPAGLNVQN
jgi:hypothetical protein